MRLAMPLVFFLCIVVGFSFDAPAQNLSPELVEAGKRVDEAFDQNLKGWTRESVVPFDGSSNVIVENWKFYDRRVRVSIGLLPADSKADYWLADFLRHDTRAKKVEGIGDAAASWRYSDSVITFHRGRFGVSVSSDVDLNLLSRDKDENRALSGSETAATSRLMACFINLALEGKLTKDRGHSSEPIFQRPCEQELVFKRLIGEELLKQLMNRY